MRSRIKQPDSPIIFALGLGLILVVTVWFQWPALDNLTWNNDEGIHLTAAYHASQGLALYREIAFSQQPLFLEWVRWPLAWSGDVAIVRQAFYLFGLLLVIAVALIGRDLKGNVAGWSAAIFLLLSPSFFYYARAVMADVPAVALGMGAGWAGLRFFQTGKRWWLIAGGVLTGLSLAFKFLTIYLVGWIGLLILYRAAFVERESTDFLATMYAAARQLLIFGVCTGATLLGVTIWYDLPALLTAVFGMRAAMREAFGGLFESNLDVLAEFWSLHTPLIFLALYGLLAQLRLPHRAFLLLTWLGLPLLMLLNHTPLYPQHLQLLLPLLAILAGVGVGHLAEWATTQRSKPTLPQSVWVGAGVLLLGWYLFFVYATRDQTTRFTQTSPNPVDDQEYLLVDFLQTFTAPGDCLLTDDLVLAFASQRFPPPGLTDVSSARLRSGSLTEAMLIDIAGQSDCQLVAPTAVRLKRSAPGFVEWAKGQYLGLWLYDQETEILIAKPIIHTQPATITNHQFGDQVVLAGYDLVETEENALYLSLYWQPLRPFEQDLTIFVHVRDSQNNTVINADHQPYDGRVPTTRWPVGQIIKETIRLDIPADVSTDQHQIVVGLYAPATGERLPVKNDASGENAVIVSTLTFP